MKKKLFALLAAAAVTASMVTVPLSSQAEEVKKTVFTPDENTSWTLFENETKGSGEVYGSVSNGTTSIDGGGTVASSSKDKPTITGSSFTFTMPADTASSTKPIQLRYSGGDLTSGVTYYFSVDYTASDLAFTGNATSGQQNVVYAVARQSDNSAGTGNKTGIYVAKGSSEMTGDTNGTITGSFTATGDAPKLEIQLYLRNATGSVTFSNIKVESDEVPESAVASFTEKGTTRYFTDVKEAFDAMTVDNGTVELLADSTLSDRVLFANLKVNTVTVNGNGHTIYGPSNRNMAFEITGRDTLTINNATVVGGTQYTINISDATGMLILNNATIGAENGVPGVRGNNGDVDANSNSVIYSYILQNPSSNIDLDETSSLKGTITVNTVIGESYQLITGTVANCTAVISGDTYVLNADGTVTPKPTETITADINYVGSYKGDSDDSEAAAWTAAFKSSTGTTTTLDTSKITWKLGEQSLEAADGSSPSNVTVTLDPNAAVVYGVIVNGVYYTDTPAELTVTID